MSIFSRLFRRKRTPFDASNYWEERYAANGTSGDGSVGRLARFKADYINARIEDVGAKSAIEFGCGDGDQLELYDVDRYVGLDVSRSIIARCGKRFASDPTKSFFVYDGTAFYDHAGVMASDVAISIDVTYHIVDEQVLLTYFDHLFGAGRSAVIIYTTDFDLAESAHIRHRKLAPYFEKFSRDFTLTESVPNAFSGTGEQESNAMFFMFKRVPAQ